MAKGNRILVGFDTVPGEGMGLVGGIIGAGITPKPGTIMQFDISEALQGGRHVVELYNADADGGRPKGQWLVLLENYMVGKPMTEAYAVGEHCFLYTPQPGNHLNLLVANLAGTADDHTKGEMLIVDDTTGLLIATTGSPETEVAMLLETITDPTEDTLAWCSWTGH